LDKHVVVRFGLATGISLPGLLTFEQIQAAQQNQFARGRLEIKKIDKTLSLSILKENSL
jgi:hypothetical protein